ncbi:MAG: hypothetical protein ACM3Y9_15210 [Ignavibacteria bacterium]
MKADVRQQEDEEAAAEVPGLMARIGHAATVRELRALDGAIGLFQRWRNRIEPPAEEDDRHFGRHAAPAPAAAAPAVPAPHNRLRGFLIVVALLLAAAFGGMLFSYSLFSRVIETNDVVIDDLRDQLAQMEKADARNLSIQAKDQIHLAEQRKTLREYQAKIAEYEDQATQLRQQIAALTPPPPRREPAVATAGGRRSAVRTAPQKTGNCVASGTNAAADLTRCVETFNRP